MTVIINPLNQYKMKNGRYMLILMDKYVSRFEAFEDALCYAANYCRNRSVYYIIVDMQLDIVVYNWSL